MLEQFSKTIILDVINSETISSNLKELLDQQMNNINRLEESLKDTATLSAKLSIPYDCQIIKWTNEKILKEDINQNLRDVILELNSNVTQIMLNIAHKNLTNLFEESEKKSHNKSKSLHL